MKSARRLEALQLQGVVDHGGQLGVEQVLAFLVAQPGVDHLGAQDVKDSLVAQRFFIRFQTGTGMIYIVDNERERDRKIYIILCAKQTSVETRFQKASI